MKRINLKHHALLRNLSLVLLGAISITLFQNFKFAGRPHKGLDLGMNCKQGEWVKLGKFEQSRHLVKSSSMNQVKLMLPHLENVEVEYLCPDEKNAETVLRLRDPELNATVNLEIKRFSNIPQERGVASVD